MKKLLTAIMVLVIAFWAVGTASAHGRFHFFGFVPFPPVVVAPAPVYYPPPYPSYGYRVWVPGHWDWRWIDQRRERVWITSYWRYGP